MKKLNVMFTIILSLGVLFFGVFAENCFSAGCGRDNGNMNGASGKNCTSLVSQYPYQDLSDEERAGLLKMREEEKRRRGEEEKRRRGEEEFQTLIIDLKRCENTIKARSSQLKAARQTEIVVNGRYKEGLATYMEVLDARALTLDARLGLLQAGYDKSSTIHRLEYLQGMVK